MTSGATREPFVDDESFDDVRDYGWLVRMWVVVAAFAAVTAVWSVRVGIPFRDPGGSILRSRAVLSLVLFGVLILVDAGVRTDRNGWTIPKAAAQLAGRWPKRRLAIALSGLVAYHLVYACYHNLKSWDVFNALRDGQLLRMDRWLFFGHSPAVLLHDVFGQHVAAYVLGVIYESFSAMVPVSFVAALVFADRIRDGYVFLMSSLWVWILGVGSYYLIPSLGPFASAPQDFAQLPHTKVTATQAKYMGQRGYLLHHPAAGDAFAQISAFASLHVGFTCMVLLMLRYYGFRRAARAMTVYLGAVIIATVYLGWHYAVDDVAGVALALLAVLLGRSTIYPRGRTRADLATTRPIGDVGSAVP